LSINIEWKSRFNFQYLLLFFGISGIIQYFLILHAEIFLPISSIFILILVPIGICLVNSTSIAILIEIVLLWRNKEIKKKRYKKDMKEFSLRKASFISLITVNGVFILTFIICSLFLYDLTILTEIPSYGNFVICELIGALPIIGIVILIDYLQHRKKKKK